MSRLVTLFGESHLGTKNPAYDGRKSLYTSKELPFSYKEFVVKLVDDNAAPDSRRFVFFVALFSIYLVYFFLFLPN